MCKIPETDLGIKDLGFKSRRGKFIAKLTDGREIVIPVSLFPDIKNLSVKDREDWMILDDQYFTFHNLTRIYAVTDLLRL